MKELSLILYSRLGCCLCKELESKLSRLSLKNFHPSLELVVIDIEAENVPREIRDRYDLFVPVMGLRINQSRKFIELPRVSPRLDDKGVAKWLEKILMETIGLLN